MTIADLGAGVSGLPLLVHAEADSLLGVPGAAYDEYLASRPPEAEASAIREVASVEGPIHILHVSSGDGVQAVSEHPGMTAETCPHYLTFTDSDVTGPLFKCAPPIRSLEHREALWEGLRSGSLEMVVSDHSPAPPELKTGDFATAWGGIASLELRLPATWTGASERGFGLDDLVRWLASEPARLAGLDASKGSIEVGKDADFAIFDPDGVTPVHGPDLRQRHPTTPYDGMTLRGRVVDTVKGSPARMLTRR
jgi:allantoinase